MQFLPKIQVDIVVFTIDPKLVVADTAICKKFARRCAICFIFELHFAYIKEHRTLYKMLVKLILFIKNIKCNS